MLTGSSPENEFPNLKNLSLRRTPGELPVKNPQRTPREPPENPRRTPGELPVKNSKITSALPRLFSKELRKAG